MDCKIQEQFEQNVTEDIYKDQKEKDSILCKSQGISERQELCDAHKKQTDK